MSLLSSQKLISTISTMNFSGIYFCFFSVCFRHAWLIEMSAYSDLFAVMYGWTTVKNVCTLENFRRFSFTLTFLQFDKVLSLSSQIYSKYFYVLILIIRTHTYTPSSQLTKYGSIKWRRENVWHEKSKSTIRIKTILFCDSPSRAVRWLVFLSLQNPSRRR